MAEEQSMDGAYVVLQEQLNDIEERPKYDVTIQHELESFKELCHQDLFSDWFTVDQTAQHLSMVQDIDQIEHSSTVHAIDIIEHSPITQIESSSLPSKANEINIGEAQKLSLVSDVNHFEHLSQAIKANEIQIEAGQLTTEIPHLNELQLTNNIQNHNEFKQFWFTCDDSEIMMKCLTLHFIGLFGNNGVRLSTLRGKKI